MIERKEVVEFILADTKRLTEVEHILDLVKNQRYEEVKKLECMMRYDVSEYIFDEEDVCLKEEEIPDGYHFAIAYWIITNGWYAIIADEDEFAVKLAEEAGKLGKSIAYKMKHGKKLVEMPYDEFLDDSDAERYDTEFGHTA